MNSSTKKVMIMKPMLKLNGHKYITQWKGPLILPYDDTTRWAYDHVNLQNIVVVNTLGSIDASLKFEAFN